MNKIFLTTIISLCSFHTFAEGYMNETMIIFSSESDGSNNPWQEKPKCIPVIQNGKSNKTWYVQYTYLDNTPLSSMRQ